MHPKVLIVGTVPYNARSSSRAFDAYFHYWEKENLAQIFSNPKKPCKGHCGTFYQITDHAVLKSWFLRSSDTGVIYYDSELEDAWETGDYEVGDNLKKVYKFGGKHSDFTHVLRGILWRKHIWCTDKLNKWLDDFKPECVFLAFSNDYFINQIALYVAKRYQIPIVSCIGDDYYFIKKMSINPIYHIYISTYRSLIRKVLKTKGSAIYISDKIRDKYNSEFGLDGETVYLNSTIQRKEFSWINKENPVITYFGNIRIGRNKSLCDIADALAEINPKYSVEVYSNEQDNSYLNVIKNNPHIKFGGSIPYEQVQKRMNESDITIVVEGFEKKDVDIARYSLSTKAADALSSGSSILTYGSIECGIIEYMISTEASMVCTEKNKLKESIEKLISDKKLQFKYYNQAIYITNEHHTLERSCAVFESVVDKVLNRG